MDNINSILNKYRIIIDDESKRHIQCRLCSKIPINPVTTPCACLFCRQCIEGYLANGDRKCPGTSDECQVQPLNFVNDIQADRRLSKDIPTLIVRCPFQLCSTKCQLKDMVAHVQVCDKTPLDCIFSLVGCNTSELLRKCMNEHLAQAHNVHMEMLIEFLRNMENKCELLTNDLNNEKMKSKQLELLLEQNSRTDKVQKEQCQHLKEFQDKILREFEKEKTERLRLQGIIEEKNKKMKELEGKTHEIESAMRAIKTNYVSETQSQTKKEKEKVYVDLASKLETLEKLVNSTEAKLTLSETNFARLDKEFKLEKRETVSKFSAFEEKLKSKIDILERAETKMLSFPERLWKRERNCWKIEQFSQKCASTLWIDSKRFYSDEGYEMSLQMWTNPTEKMSLHLYLQKGKFDDQQQWPMPLYVSVSIANQYNGSSYRCWTFSRETSTGPNGWNKPTSLVYAHSVNDVPSLAEMVAVPGVLIDDTLEISCVTSPSRFECFRKD